MSPIGVLGGTFDPFHRGHLALARGVLHTCGLERVVFLPSAVPPHKPSRPVSAGYHRLEMIWLGIEGHHGLGVHTIELAAGGIRYTIDTLRSLREDGLNPVFIVGTDALAEIDLWRESAALLRSFDFVAIERPSDGTRPEAGEVPAHVLSHLVSQGEASPGADLGRGGRIWIVPVTAPAVSSSLVRSVAASSRATDHLVPPRTARYIERHRLYQ